MESKREIRQRILKLRNSIPPEKSEEASSLIAEKVFALPAFQKSDIVFCYVSFKSEVSTKKILEYCWRIQKKTAVPKVLGEKMEFFFISSYEDLKTGYFGVPEPEEKFPAPVKNALVLVPGVAFDENRNRIGYGRGFYDNYFIKHPGLKSAALAFDIQVIEKIEPDAYDVRPECIITEKRFIGVS